MWTKREVEEFVLNHPIDCTYKDGYQVPGKPRRNPHVLSAVETVVDEDGYGADIHHEVKLLPNLRHCPQHTLLTVLEFMYSAVDLDDVKIWNHPNGGIRIMFTEQVNPGP